MASIYIYSPSGAVRDRAAFRRGVRYLQQLGHDVEVDQAALASHQRFAGDDATRLAALGRAAASGADVALITRGGYGITRLLDAIDYQALAQAIGRGTRFVGLSDFTALQLALLARTGAVSWAGPALCEGFGVAPGVDMDGPDEIMVACFDDLLQGQGEGAGWRQPRLRATQQAALDTFHRARVGDDAQFSVTNAVLWGGNLSMLCNLVGTPYLPEVPGGVLFLEDVGEHPYRIERMLTQLLRADILRRQKAILLGQFTEYKLSGHDRSFRFDTVVDWLRSQLKVPVLTGLPYGHVPTKVLLPVGARVDVAVQGRDVLIGWGHVN